MQLSTITAIFSAQKNKKLRLLVRELWLRACYVVRTSKYSLIKNKFLETASAEQTETAQKALLQYDQWHYECQVSVPEVILDNMTVNHRQDIPTAPSSLKASYEHAVILAAEAAVYSNGASHVSVFDANGTRLSRYCHAKYNFFVPERLQIPVSRYISGTTLNLYENIENTSGNPGHWIIDALAQLFLALRFYKAEDIDYVLVPALHYQFQKDSLARLGFNSDKCIEIQPLECVRCEYLIATTSPRGFSSGITPGWIIEAYRERFVGEMPPLKKGKRIYVSRRDARSRKFINEEALIARLEAHGFETVETSKYQFDEKIKLFSDAEIIVGLTGASLTSFIFCHPRASVLELFPDSFVHYFYSTMCDYIGLDYHALVFENKSVVSRFNKYYGNLFIEPSVLDNRVQEIIMQREELEGSEL